MLGGRILIFGAAWVAAMSVAATVLKWPLRSIPRPTPATAPSSEVTPLVKRSEIPVRFPGWTVTRAFSAHHVMVVDVETDQPQQAKQIALQIVEPIKSRYEEVLIYVRRPGTSGQLAARRVQWTPRGGYVEVVY